MFPNKELKIVIPVLRQTNITKYTVKSPLNISSQANASLIKTSSPTSNPLTASKTVEMSSKIYPTCEYVLHFDGCSKGNPGPAGIGAVISKLGKEEWCGCQFIGNKTNNQSEYSALILGLKEAISRNIKQLQVYGDSLLVINQVTGKFNVKNVQLQELYKEAINLIGKFDYIVFNHVYREFNKRADQLSNLALEVCDN
jgi:ribonuclease HI